MTDQDKMRARLDELWSSYVLESYPDTKPDTEDRAISAIKLLENLRTIHADAKEKGDTEKVARSIDFGLQFGRSYQSNLEIGSSTGLDLTCAIKKNTKGKSNAL